MMKKKKAIGISKNIKGKIKPKKQLPTFLTMINAILGFFAIILIFKEQYNLASLLVISAFIFDILDGMLARKFQVTSDFGAELDSLADTVSFVIVPALLIYFVFFETQRYGFVAAIIAVICGISRLAKFNVTRNSKSFIGMPTPMFAMIIVAMVFLDLHIKEQFALIFFFIMSYLMVSPLKYPSFKDPKMSNYKYAGIMLLVLLITAFLLKIPLLFIAIGVNVFVCLFLCIPLMFSPIVKQKKKLTLFYVGYILGIVAFYKDPKMLLALPFLYSVVAGWLIEAALTTKKRGDKDE